MSSDTVPAAPSPQTATVFTSLSVSRSGHTDGSSEQVLIGLPVASLLQSEKFVKGITILWKSALTGASKWLLNPSVYKSEQNFILFPNWNRKPSYSAFARAFMTIALQEEMSGNFRNSFLCVWALIKPGALRLGTSTTWPRNSPKPFMIEKFPVD